MDVLDISTYITEKGMLRLDDFLKDLGYLKAEDFLNTPIDTVAIARMHRIHPATLRKYVNDGHLVLDPSRRLTIREATKIDICAIQQRLRMEKPVPKRQQRREFKKK